MESQPAVCHRRRTEDMCCPTVKGQTDDIYHMLRHSFVEILKMRRSIESMDALIEQSTEAILESREMLKRTQQSGFLTRG
jgi:hypothetical protein